MQDITRSEFKKFALDKFEKEGSAIRFSPTHKYCYIQAGEHLGNCLHYEYHKNHVHLHIEGQEKDKRKALADYLAEKNTGLKVSDWGMKNCCFTLDKVLNSWEEIQDGFLEISQMLDPYIKKYEASLESADQSVSAQFISIKDCLHTSKELSIPYYQRPYRWTARNVDQLLEDINCSKSNGKLQFLIGTVILHNENGIHNIVDGQQRITTITLILKALGQKDGLPELKFDHSVSKHRIKENFAHIKFWIDSNIKDKDAFREYILESCCFVEIVVRELSEAFQMFESQNGRGKELEAYNLLKAYHIRAMGEAPHSEKVNCDARWEDAVMFEGENGRIDLLLQLFNEQLYRSRIWSRSKDAFSFSKKHIDEFKGLTLDQSYSPSFAYQNILIQQEYANHLLQNFNRGLLKIKGRFTHGDPSNINPFVNINQLFINGKAFFEYVETYVEIYKRLFLQLNTSQMQEFKQFYKKYCLYPNYLYRRGDGYIREAFKSAIICMFDRFGEVGVNQYYKDLYICFYRHRLEKSQIRYETMAKHHNVGWIFRDIVEAKNLTDLLPIRQNAREYIANFKKINFSVTEIEEFFKAYKNGETR